MRAMEEDSRSRRSPPTVAVGGNLNPNNQDYVPIVVRPQSPGSAVRPEVCATSTHLGKPEVKSSNSSKEPNIKEEGKDKKARPGQKTVSFPQLSNNVPIASKPNPKSHFSGDDDEEPARTKGFQGSTSPTSVTQRNKGAEYQKVNEEGICKMHKLSLYETASRYYLVGGDIVDRKFKMLKIDRTAESGDLIIVEDDIIYTKKEMNQLLDTIDEGNKISGGLKLKCSTWGLLGFIRFTGAYYMLLITKRSQVAMIGGHYIYQVDGTDLISLTTSSSSRFKLDRDSEESRFIGILHNLDLSRSFYFSYSYDITRTLQHNIVGERQALQKGRLNTPHQFGNSMFIWNHHLLNPALKTLKNTYDWCLPIVHGFVDQASKWYL